MKSDLPNASQFSPVQTPLPELLLVVLANEPSRQNIQSAIASRFFEKSTDPFGLADNTIFALSEYGLLDKPVEDQSSAALTDVGRSLAIKASLNDYSGMYAEFARHILLNLRGLDLLTCAADLNAAGISPTKARIVKELGLRGIYHPPNGTHANGMRQWLEQAGVVDKGKWVANPLRLAKLLGGTEQSEIDQYAGLTREQIAFARAFARLGVPEARSNQVATYAASLFGVEYPEGGLPQSTLFALRDAELIECEKTTGGQGAKPYIVRPTEKLKNEFIEQIFTAIENSAGVQYRNLIRMPYAQILEDLHSTSTQTKGKALEALAFFLARVINLEFVNWRLRSNKTGGAEIDVIMEGTNLIFSRWQIQCKNSKEATLDDVAKEVGLAQIINSNVIMIVTTGRLGSAARKFADQVMRDTNLHVILISGKELQSLRDTPAAIVDILNDQAHGAMQLKRSQIEKAL